MELAPDGSTRNTLERILTLINFKVRMKEKKLAKEIVVVSCGPQQAQVLTVLFISKEYSHILTTMIVFASLQAFMSKYVFVAI